MHKRRAHEKYKSQNATYFNGMKNNYKKFLIKKNREIGRNYQAKAQHKWEVFDLYWLKHEKYILKPQGINFN